MSDTHCKTCTKCGAVKPATEFHADKSRRDGLNSRCKDCTLAACREWHGKNRESANARRAAWREANPQHTAKKNREWYVANREAVLADKRAYYAARRDVLLASRRARRAKDPAQASARHRAYLASREGVVGVYNGRRRAAQLSATPSWADEEKIRAIYAEAQRRRSLGEDVHVDHIVPLVNELVCGLHVEHNLQILLAVDNLQKSNRFAVA